MVAEVLEIVLLNDTVLSTSISSTFTLVAITLSVASSRLSGVFSLSELMRAAVTLTLGVTMLSVKFAVVKPLALLLSIGSSLTSVIIIESALLLTFLAVSLSLTMVVLSLLSLLKASLSLLEASLSLLKKSLSLLFSPSGSLFFVVV